VTKKGGNCQRQEALDKPARPVVQKHLCLEGSKQELPAVEAELLSGSSFRGFLEQLPNQLAMGEIIGLV
jgi:hypothetical protein